MDNAIIAADSLNAALGVRITTFILPRFPKCLLAELNTHRMFSRNAASSRAIPIKRVIDNVRKDPYIPSFTRNKSGMGGVDNLTNQQKFVAELIWLDTMEDCISQVEELSSNVGVAKQEANRLLEPFMRVPVIVTATDWDNFFRLRCHPAAQPDFRIVAEEMKQLYKENEPESVAVGDWHAPFSDDVGCLDDLKVATARCARISYATHDGEHSTEKDLALHDRLLEDGHMSPFEHCAKAMDKHGYVGNFRGWSSYRTLVGR